MIEERNGVRNWASILDEPTRLQAEKLARCPAISGPVALMPDAHVGIGATVGSVIVTENAIIPAAVGVDIGCGMIACRTDLVASDLPDTLQPLISVFARDIPGGNGQGSQPAEDVGCGLDGCEPSWPNSRSGQESPGRRCRCRRRTWPDPEPALPSERPLGPD